MKPFLLDATERVAATFLQAFFGALALSAASPLDISALHAAAGAGAAAALAAGKAAVARFRNNPDTASLLRGVTDVLPNC